MPTVIDALVVELHLDPTQYKKGLQEALGAATKSKENLVKGAREVETSTKGMNEQFSLLRNNLLGAAALITGGLGLKDFVQKTTNTNVSLGRLNQITGVSIQQLGAWRAAGLLAGGTAESFTNIFKTLTMEMAQLTLTGTSDVIPLFRALGIDILDVTKNFTDFSGVIGAITKAVNEGRGTNAERATLLQRLGVDEAGISAILKGEKIVSHFYEEGKRVSSQTEKDVKAANELTEAYNKLFLASENIGQSMLRRIDAAKILNDLAEMLITGEPSSEEQKEFEGRTDVLESLIGIIFGPKTVQQYRAASGATASAPPPSAAVGGPGALRTKANVGTAGPGIGALAQSLQAEIPGLNRFTAFNDRFHAGTGSKHAQDLALDFTLRDPSTSAAVAAQIRAKLLGLGVQGTVLDEYANPSPGATGGHIHVQFSDAAAAAKFAGIPGIGGAGAAGGAAAGGGARGNTSTTDVNINTLIVQAPQGADADAFAGAIKNSLKTLDMGVQANTGQE